MDPFNSLPVELLVRILAEVQSERTTAKFTAASPTILRAYASNTAHILSQRVANDFDELMIQDAMFIILCPPLSGRAPSSSTSNPSSSSSDTQRSLQRLLAARNCHRLVNPLVSRDMRLLSSLQQLHSHLLLYIEDYLTKATGVHPPRDYLCLPDRSGYLTFKGRKISKRLDAECLRSSERIRLFRAFLRSGVMEKVWHLPPGLRTENQLSSYGDRKFVDHEDRAMHCVWSYKESLRCALAAHYGECSLPNVPKSFLSSSGSFLADRLLVSAWVHRSESQNSPPNPLETLGMIGNRIRAQLCTANKGRTYNNLFGSRLIGSTGPIHGPLDEFMVSEGAVGSVIDDGVPGLYARYYTSASGHMIEIYNQRACAFLDDDRLFPKDAPIPVFPTDEELEIEHTRAANLARWAASSTLDKRFRRS